MKKFAPLVVVIVAFAVMVTPTAFAGKADNCVVLDSGRITPPAGTVSVTVTAPEGFLISDYCVKSGNVKSGGGAVNVNNEDAATVTIRYPGGKTIGHYSYSNVRIPVDVCPNLAGNQAAVPAGYELVNGLCTLIPPPDQKVTPSYYVLPATCDLPARLFFPFDPFDEDGITYAKPSLNVVTATADPGYDLELNPASTWTGDKDFATSGFVPLADQLSGEQCVDIVVNLPPIQITPATCASGETLVTPSTVGIGYAIFNDGANGSAVHIGASALDGYVMVIDTNTWEIWSPEQPDRARFVYSLRGPLTGPACDANPPATINIDAFVFLSSIPGQFHDLFCPGGYSATSYDDSRMVGSHSVEFFVPPYSWTTRNAIRVANTGTGEGVAGQFSYTCTLAL